MKKILGFAVAVAAMTTSAMAAKNMENPLYMPYGGELYSKTSFGVMYKKTDDTLSQILRNTDGNYEFPSDSFFVHIVMCVYFLYI